MLAKSGQVRNVLWTPAVEELQVFFDHLVPYRRPFGIIYGETFPVLLRLQCGDESGVAPFTKMQAIFGPVR